MRRKNKYEGKERKTEISLNTEKEEEKALLFFRVEQSKGHAPIMQKEERIIRITYYVPKKKIEDLFKN